ncbi:VWA domain-containing protein [Acidipropionibacterium timonense]|uniref:VWA domain-containing protein n=1 Tax=Acidipropionibacterium timonense TaxID=2161818 RepID=UPI00103097C8|nr:VWA domain-containing protein [Acidipropionibacterium timonense]
MALIWWPLGAVLLVLGIVAAVIAARWPRRRGAVTGVVVAHLDRLRRLPRYRVLVAQRRRRLAAVCLCWALALTGAALTASRLIRVDDDAPDERSRDIVLCLDVSSSMAKVDADVLDTFTDLSGRLGRDRIGLVAFDSSAVTVIPLTKDASAVREALSPTRASVTGDGVPGTSYGQNGSSLIGDGIASCLNRFDDLDRPRSRTLVLATDGLVSGAPLYTMSQAMDTAVAKGVMVFGVVPAGNDEQATRSIHDQVRRTHGDSFSLVAGRPANPSLIADRIRQQERTALLATPHQRVLDEPWPGVLLMLLGSTCGAVLQRKEVS